jgi:hypothetical protein
MKEILVKAYLSNRFLTHVLTKTLVEQHQVYSQPMACPVAHLYLSGYGKKPKEIWN